VVLDFDIPQGVQGDQGVEISAVEPENLTVLWADTSEQGDAVLPLGGGGGAVVGEGVGGRLRHDMGRPGDVSVNSRTGTVEVGQGVRPFVGLGLPLPSSAASFGAGYGSNNLFFWAIPVPIPVEIDQIGIHVQLAAAGGTVELALWRPLMVTRTIYGR
jgi:hypothetical protein